MATKRDTTHAAKQTGKTTARSTRSASSERYPDWKVELFRAGIAERRSSASGQMSGRATRAPGA